MKIPSKIRIGDSYYTVKKSRKSFKYSDGSGTGIGEISYTTGIIKTVVGDKREKQILLHELFHGILYFLGDTKTMKEETIDRFTSALRMVMIDNPALLELLKK
jgi:hypothetical protein